MKNIFNIFCLLASQAFAAGNKGRRHLPEAAFTACENKSEGDCVSIISPEGNNVKASCQPMKGKLVALLKRKNS